MFIKLSRYQQQQQQNTPISTQPTIKQTKIHLFYEENNNKTNNLLLTLTINLVIY